MIATRLLLLVATVTLTCRANPTPAQIEIAVGYINGLIDVDIRRLPGFVRLSFHDCVGAGGCDGCIDFENPDNNGIRVYSEALDISYGNNNLAQVMSRADFYALSAIVALQRATPEDARFSDEQFRVGRKDCLTSPFEDVTEEDFPSPKGNFEEVTGYFAEHFDMTPRETNALMGAHTLGRAREGNSGYEGAWVPSQEGNPRQAEYVLDNRFYVEMANRPWEHVTVAGDSSVNPQWQIPGTERNQPNEETATNFRRRNMFLNSDICLINDFVLSDDDLADCVMCGYRDNDPRTRPPPNIDAPCCEVSAGANDALSFRDNNALWVGEFTDVFYKMIDKVADGVDLVAPSVTPSPSTESPSTSPESPSPSPETPSPSPETPNPSPETPSPSPETPSPSPQTPSPSPETRSPSPNTPRPTRRTRRTRIRNGRIRNGRRRQRQKDEISERSKTRIANLIRQLEDVEKEVTQLQDSL